MYPRSSMNPKYKKYKEDYNKVNYNFTAQNQWQKDPKKSTKKKITCAEEQRKDESRFLDWNNATMQAKSNGATSLKHWEENCQTIDFIFN